MSKTRLSRTIASASHPVERSRLRAELIATAAARPRKAAASTFCMKETRSFISGSGDAQRPDVRQLAGQDLHRLRVPLVAGASIEDGNRFVDRLRLAIGPVRDQRVVRVAHGDDPREVRDGAPREAVWITAAVV